MLLGVKNRLLYLKNHYFIRRVAVLQIGGVMGTLLQAMAGVFLARILQPERYGVYALAFSVASISSVFIGGGITDAITPAISRAWATKDRDHFQSAIGFYFHFITACAAITLIVLLFLPAITTKLYHSPAIGRYASVVIIASIVSISMFALVQLILQVTGRIRTMASLTLADVITRYGLMLIFSLLGFGIWGAIVGHFLGALIIMLISAIIYVYLTRAELFIPRLKHFFTLARRASWQPFLKPTLWVLADSNFALLYGALPVAMVGLYASGVELAYFKLAFGYIILAMSAMAPISTVMNVHFPTVEATAPNQLRQRFIRVTMAAIALSTAITVLVLAMAPIVFRILYGVVYLPAVSYVYGFAVFGALFGLGVGLGPMWRAVNQVKISIIINLIILGIGVPTGLYLIKHFGIWGAVIVVTLWFTVSHLVSFIYLAKKLKKYSDYNFVKK